MTDIWLRQRTDVDMREYVVMRDDIAQEPHRRPFRRTEDGNDVCDLTPIQQREWCEDWIAECEDDGMRRGMFYVASRTVTDWKRLP